MIFIKKYVIILLENEKKRNVIIMPHMEEKYYLEELLAMNMRTHSDDEYICMDALDEMIRLIKEKSVYETVDG